MSESSPIPNQDYVGSSPKVDRNTVPAGQDGGSQDPAVMAEVSSVPNQDYLGAYPGVAGESQNPSIPDLAGPELIASIKASDPTLPPTVPPAA